jgi:type IV secretory pathway ATPase VirB11/archaellum biosynthesis ATPase
MTDVSQADHLALQILKPLAVHYLRPELEEVVINRPGEIWYKHRQGGGWEAVEDANLTYDRIAKICRVLANINGARFNETDLPVVSCELPGQPYRFQALMGQNVRYNLGDRKGVGVAIRSLAAPLRDFDAWRPDHRAGGSDAFLIEQARLEEDFAAPDDVVDGLRMAIDRGETILVSGATSTGKTSFTNRVISIIERDARIVTVEDTRELTVPHPNRLHLIVPRNRGSNAFGWNQAIDSLMRLTPDWIVCGELSVANAATIYNLMGKGHPVITTVHAGSAEEAMQAFVNNMSADGSNLDPRSTLDDLHAKIGCIVQLDRHNGRRHISEVAFPAAERRREQAIRRAERRQDLDGRVRRLAEAAR